MCSRIRRKNLEHSGHGNKRRGFPRWGAIHIISPGKIQMDLKREKYQKVTGEL